MYDVLKPSVSPVDLISDVVCIYLFLGGLLCPQKLHLNFFRSGIHREFRKLVLKR